MNAKISSKNSYFSKSRSRRWKHPINSINSRSNRRPITTTWCRIMTLATLWSLLPFRWLSISTRNIIISMTPQSQIVTRKFSCSSSVSPHLSQRITIITTITDSWGRRAVRQLHRQIRDVQLRCLHWSEARLACSIFPPSISSHKSPQAHLFHKVVMHHLQWTLSNWLELGPITYVSPLRQQITNRITRNSPRCTSVSILSMCKRRQMVNCWR